MDGSQGGGGGFLFLRPASLHAPLVSKSLALAWFLVRALRGCGRSPNRASEQAREEGKKPNKERKKEGRKEGRKERKKERTNEQKEQQRCKAATKFSLLALAFVPPWRACLFSAGDFFLLLLLLALSGQKLSDLSPVRVRVWGVGVVGLLLNV